MKKPDRFNNRFIVFFSMILPLACILVSIFLWRNLVKQPDFHYLVVSSESKTLSDLFNSQLANILTLIGFFGVFTPIATYIIQRQSLKDERTAFFNEVEEETTIINGKIADLQKQLLRESQKSSEREKQQTYNFGMHWYMLGNARDWSVGRWICWFYALDQFVKYCPDKKFVLMIDATISNIETELYKKDDEFKNFSIFGPYNKVALKALHRIKRRKDIAPMYTEDASKLYETIKKNIKEEKLRRQKKM